MENIGGFSFFGLFFFLFLFLFLYAVKIIFKNKIKRIKSAFYLAAAAFCIWIVCYFFRSFIPAGFLKTANISYSLLSIFSVLTAFSGIIFNLFSEKTKINISTFAQDMALAVSYILSSFIVLSAYGANLSGILATSAVLTGVVAFSIQDTLSNIIGGTVIHLENSFKPGDMIEIDGKQGILKELRWRYASLETLDGDLLIIPNIMLMKGVVNVMGKAAGNIRFREVVFNVFYDVPPGKIIKIIEDAFVKNPPKNVSPNPKPYCALKEFQPNCAVYSLRYYLSDLYSPGRTDSDVRIKIYYALAREGIELFVPNRSVVTSEAAKEFRENKENQEHSKRVSALKSVDIFKPLNEEELKSLASSLEISPFHKGEIIMNQGESADSFYIICSGQVDIILSSSSNSFENKVIKTLGSGDFFGEMGLLTGEPRTATAVSNDETLCYRISKKGFSSIISSRPQIAESVAEILAGRKSELSQAKEKMKNGETISAYGEKKNILSKIRNFFNI
ncbi:MAG: mechanosensitive ion channel [Elusimicrobia bacterium]|nr:mechanosensitive ion channel [Elusimicrobiota bacterium]